MCERQHRKTKEKEEETQPGCGSPPRGEASDDLRRCAGEALALVGVVGLGWGAVPSITFITYMYLLYL